MEIVNIVVLSLSSILLVYAGTMRLIKPLKSLCLKTYTDDPSIKLKGEVDVFNEMRGAGASLALGGVMILLGTIVPILTFPSFLVAIVIFIGHALGRLISLNGDGKPNQPLIQGLMSELILGAANVFCFVYTLV